jgi:tryptophanyl-tRNA synthetase
MRIFSGIQPTGTKHFGVYSGAFRQFVPIQEEGEAFFCIVDLHSITTAHEPEELRESTLDLAAIMFAIGLDPDRSTIFVQSHVSAHPEAAWLLGSVTSYGQLGRMTQFKDKSERQEFISAGLFTYPVLMAGDILLYQTDVVPIGDDQKQHLELTRDLAQRFNSRYGEIFKVPEGRFPETGGRIMDLQEPERKMSTTDGQPLGTVLITDPPDTIRKKVKAAVTDSGTDVRYEPEEKPGISNLLEIMSVATGEPIADLAQPNSRPVRGTARRRAPAALAPRTRCRQGTRDRRAHARADVRADGVRQAVTKLFSGRELGTPREVR